MSLVDARDFFPKTETGQKRKCRRKKLLYEILRRLQFLIQLGLDYLTLDRSAMTLSGGEAQRVRLATQLGRSWPEYFMFSTSPVLDSIRKTLRNCLVLKQLRDAGNSVVVVEHDQETIEAAEHIIDMGPGAGVKGGEIVAQGTLAEIMENERSLTGRYLSGRMKMPIPARRRTGTGELLVIKGAKKNNLKSITVQIPVGLMTCITGVSGSGKSSLVMDILYNAVAQSLHKSTHKVGQVDELIGANFLIVSSVSTKRPLAAHRDLTLLLTRVSLITCVIFSRNSRKRGYEVINPPGFLLTRRAAAARRVAGKEQCK